MKLPSAQEFILVLDWWGNFKDKTGSDSAEEFIKWLREKRKLSIDLEKGGGNLPPSINSLTSTK